MTSWSSSAAAPQAWPGEAARELREAERAANCYHPVLLKGSTRAVDLASGELRTMYTTASEPDGVLPVACGNRREAVCPPCSAVYKRDARQLVPRWRSGLSGALCRARPARLGSHRRPSDDDPSRSPLVSVLAPIRVWPCLVHDTIRTYIRPEWRRGTGGL